jgi:double-strand break repair protein MRE11
MFSTSPLILPHFTTYIGTFRIYQPGSSVATSLSEGESAKFPKSFGIIEINLSNFRLLPIPYKQIRPFFHEDVCLLDEGLNPTDTKLEHTMKTILTNKANEVIQLARSLWLDTHPATPETQPPALFKIKDPHKVLIKLRVDHTGFSTTLHAQRFGSQFMNEVANPDEMISFIRRKKEGDGVRGKGEIGGGEYQSEFDALRLNGDTEGLSRIKVEDLVCEALSLQNKQLGILKPGSVQYYYILFIFCLSICNPR